MRKLMFGLAALALLSLAPGARAQGGTTDSSDTRSGSQGTGGSGSTGSMGGAMGAMGEQSMEGRVLKADKTMITIEHMGTAIPLMVSSSTSFQGVKSVKEIKEGQQVRASFDLKKDKNELKSVEVLSGTGGTGATDMGTPPPSGKNKSNTGGTY
jgi:hypothetical protein